MLDRWAANTKLVVQETPYAGFVRGEVRQAAAALAAAATPEREKTIVLPAQAQSSVDELEI